MKTAVFIKKRGFTLCLAALIGFALTWIYLIVLDESESPFDAWTYLKHSEGFLETGLFNLKGYAELWGTSYRGYLLPWLMAVFAKASQLVPLLDYRFFVSLFSSLACTIALPNLMERVFSVRVGAIRRVLVQVLMVVFFQGLLSYTLSDLWAAGLAVMAICALMTAAHPGESTPARLWASAALGFCLGGAYNIRTIYLLLLGICCIVFPVLLAVKKEIRWPAKLYGLLCFAGGFLLVSFPQMLINHYVYSSWSFLLMSAEGSSLFINQLYDGIYIMKYESYSGVDYWSESINYVDPVGAAILDAEGMNMSFTFGEGAKELGGIQDYLQLVLRYPLDFIGIYARHLINLVDIRYPEIFVRDLEANAWIPFANYTVIYGALATFWQKWKQMDKRANLWLLAMLLLPTLCILAGAIEVRFSIVLMMVLWGILLTCADWKLLQSIRPRAWIGIAIAYVLFLCVLCAIGGQTMMTFTDVPTLY